MNPMLLSILLSAGGGLLEKLFQGNQPKTIDPTQAWMEQFNQQNGLPAGNRDVNYGKSQKLWEMLNGGGAGDPTTYLTQMQTALNGTGDATDYIRAAAEGYDPQAGYRAFMEANPSLRENALGFARDAINPFGNDIRTLADAQSLEAANSVASGFGGTGLLGSGAAMAAIGNAAARPKLDALTAISQLQGQLATQTYGNLAPGVLSGFNQGELGRTSMRMDAGRSALEALLQKAGIYQSAASPLLALLGQEGGSTFMTPQFIQNPDYQSDSDIWSKWFGIGTGIAGLPNAASAPSGSMTTNPI